LRSLVKVLDILGRHPGPLKIQRKKKTKQKKPKKTKKPLFSPNYIIIFI